MPTKIEIKNRWSNAVIFTCDVPDQIALGLALKYAVQNAVSTGADLTGAYLTGADLRGADLRGAYLRGAYLRGADLTGADLRGADLTGAYLTGADLTDADLTGAYLTGANGEFIRATDDQSIENLDKVRAIILDNQARLDMDGWHQTDEWKERTCAEETMCETTHCLAGWLQVCSNVPEIRKMDAHLAGIMSAPIAAKMFFREPEEVLEWLDKRAYVNEIAEVQP